ncbi:hypothetical protein LV83_03506 [Algoriphagus yeomjeoni]|uniref:Uncharacterized protein n=1 Tax=Algoriphagus yeomjeoni TaxID=291403 RepID=A0A327P0H6_9BACT|nr:hypothetical protein LV83_03506 [Algoriphagus yeomjeoni]
MQLIEVTKAAHQKEFIEMAVRLYKMRGIILREVYKVYKCHLTLRWKILNAHSFNYKLYFNSNENSDK